METKIMNLKVANMKVPRLVLLALFIGSILSCVGISYYSEHKSKEFVRENTYLNDLKRYVLDLDNVHDQLEILKPQFNNKSEQAQATLQALAKKREYTAKALKSFVRDARYVGLAIQVDKLSETIFAEIQSNPEVKVKKLAKNEKNDRGLASVELQSSEYHRATKRLVENINGVLIFNGALRSKHIVIFNLLNLVFGLLACTCGLILIRRLFRAEELLRLKSFANKSA